MFQPLIHKVPYGATAVGKLTKITFPLPADSGVERVFVVLRKEDIINRVELPKRNISDSNSDEIVFEGSFTVTEPGIWFYRFEGELSYGGAAFYGRSSDGSALREDFLPEWQLTVVKTDYKVPFWTKQGIIYHIFADRFCKAEDRPFTKRGRLHADWNDRPDIPAFGEEYRADDFFGGNIAGIISKLDYLKSLNVTAIYLSPIFESSSNHRYDTGDYLKIDELFGDEKQFAELISEAGNRSIKIILDGVFNHTGADSLYFNKYGRYQSLGAYQSKDSPFFDWYFFNRFPDDYDCWWGSTVVPTVNKSSKGYRDLILGSGGVIEKWGNAGIGGWRLDVVDELPIGFTTDLCKKIKAVDKNAYIVGEVWEDATTKVSYGERRPYFMGDQLDSVMNYTFKRAIESFVLGGGKDKFIADVSLILENYPKESLDSLMNLIGSHDTVRALTLYSGAELPGDIEDRARFRLGGYALQLAKKRLMLASALQYTLPGVPSLFYGDEAGAEGCEDPMNRITYPWGNEDAELLAHYRALGEMRIKNAELLQGETTFVSDVSLLIYTRKHPDGSALTVYANASGDTVVRESAAGKNALTGKPVSGITLPPLSFAIVKTAARHACHSL